MRSQHMNFSYPNAGKQTCYGFLCVYGPCMLLLWPAIWDLGPSPGHQYRHWRENLQQSMVFTWPCENIWNLVSLEIFIQPILEKHRLIIYPKFKVFLIIDIHPINGWILFTNHCLGPRIVDCNLLVNTKPVQQLVQICNLEVWSLQRVVKTTVLVKGLLWIVSPPTERRDDVYGRRKIQPQSSNTL